MSRLPNVADLIDAVVDEAWAGKKPDPAEARVKQLKTSAQSARKIAKRAELELKIRKDRERLSRVETGRASAQSAKRL